LTLRRFAARYGDAAVESIGAEVFASPDIDMDLPISSLESRCESASARFGTAEEAQLEWLVLNVVDAQTVGASSITPNF
jgi:hypothetical protein